MMRAAEKVAKSVWHPNEDEIEWIEPNTSTQFQVGQKIKCIHDIFRGIPYCPAKIQKVAKDKVFVAYDGCLYRDKPQWVPKNRWSQRIMVSAKDERAQRKRMEREERKRREQEEAEKRERQRERKEKRRRERQKIEENLKKIEILEQVNSGNIKLNEETKSSKQEKDNIQRQYNELNQENNKLNQENEGVRAQNNELKTSNIKLKHRIQTLEQANAETQRKYDKVNSGNIKLNKETKSVKQQNDALEQQKDDIQRQYNELNQENNKIREQNAEEITLKNTMIRSLNEQNESLKHKNNEFKSSNIKLNEECKELQTDLNEIKNKYEKLYRMKHVDESDYMNWNSDDIADWIMNLDPQYEVYEETLRMNLKKEDVDGSILGDLDKTDLHRFGIISLKHKLAIAKKIKELMHKVHHLPQNDEGRGTLYI